MLTKRKIAGIFDIDETEINRPDEGEIDMLIGLQYAAFHPVPVSTSGHLILYRNCFGTVIGGRHPDIHEEIQIDESCSSSTVIVMHTTHLMDTFFEVENL